MKFKALAFAACAAAAVHAHAEPASHLMPQPSSFTQGSGVLPLTTTFAVDAPNADARLQQAIDRATRRVEYATGLSHAGPGITATTRLIVKVAGPGEPIQSLDENETYTLTITPSGAEIDAPTDVGAIHALETLIQLIQPDADGYALPAVTINDAPRFRWRGLMIDCGRHFEPIPVLRRTLDGMAAVKLNVFHWHLTEDQGFRIQSKLYPRLTANGSDGLFYTQEEARDLVAYASARGIRVVPEFEMPGHSTAWLVAYPDFASGTTPTGIRREFGVSPYALDPTRDETYAFIDKFLGEMATIFPDAYMHIGGDETPAPDWKTNPRILAFMKAHNLAGNDALQAYFNTRVLKTLTRLHKHMMGWDEILAPGLPTDIAIQSWRGEASLAKGAKLGYDGVLSAPYYLDAMKPAGTYYLADPLPSTSDLTPEQRRHILGGEVCMWAEHLDARTIDSRIWPRTAAIAERFWSPESVRDVPDMYRRLLPASLELETLGLTHLQSGPAALRNLAATEDIDALRTFASAFEPVSFGERYKAQRTSQLTALDRFVDAVRPDPPSRFWSESQARLVATSPDARADLDRWFTRLAASVPTVRQQMQTAPRLRDVSLRADQLLALATTAHEALTYISTNTKPTLEWQANATKQIEDAQKPSALVRFTFLPCLSDLVAAASRWDPTSAPVSRYSGS